MAEQKWIAEEGSEGRLDKYLSENADLSRTQVQQLAKEGNQ